MKSLGVQRLAGMVQWTDVDLGIIIRSDFQTLQLADYIT